MKVLFVILVVLAIVVNLVAWGAEKCMKRKLNKIAEIKKGNEKR